MNVLRTKPGVQHDPAPAGYRILSALEITARRLQIDLTITCGTEGHPPDDPHTKGEAYDVRTHDLTDAEKLTVLRELMIELAENHGLDGPFPTGIGIATLRFYGQIEHPGEPAEHLHIQRRKGTRYP